MSAKKHLILWVHERPLKSEQVFKDPLFDDCDFIEVQDSVLALKFLQAHSVSVLAASSRLGCDFFRQASEDSPTTTQILILREDEIQNTPEFLNAGSLLLILKENCGPEFLQAAFAKALADADLSQNRIRLRKESSRQNKELEALNDDLERIVNERTAHIELAKTEEEENLNKVRTLIRFIKELGTVGVFEELLQVLRKETRKFGKLGDPLLILRLQPDVTIIYSFQAGHFVKSDSRRPLALPTEIVMSAPEVGTYLANHFGRPFMKITAVPLEVKLIQKLADTQAHAVLCIENSNSEMEARPLMDFISERFQPLSMSVDRILLEQEQAEIAFRWERTFDSLRDPISIVDVDYEVLRANRLYADRLSKKKCYQSFANRSVPCEGCALAEALSEGKPKQGVIQKGDKIFEVHSYPITIEGGRATNVVNHYVDITQDRSLYIQMLQSEKMGALGLLAGNIAHELNNPLTGLRSLAQVLLRQVPPSSNIRSDLEEIEKATARSQKIIKNLQQFSKKETAEKERVSMDEIVDRTMPMLKSLVRTHRMEVDMDTQDYLVEVEPQLIQQVVFNLINNACQAMESPGTLTVRSTYDPQSQSVSLMVADTGPGIAPEIMNKIFNPFFTTKKEGHGTGLGLSLSKEIIENHGGQVRVTSTVGTGSQFYIQLPVVNI